VQGKSADIGGYYLPDAEKTAAVMRPSTTFNDALAALLSPGGRPRIVRRTRKAPGRSVPGALTDC
ncbi:MAG: NADP-dependent isocitrate dehydrogenase, partial [Trebonia sp.]